MNDNMPVDRQNEMENSLEDFEELGNPDYQKESEGE